jgi:hypothetical protein
VLGVAIMLADNDMPWLAENASRMTPKTTGDVHMTERELSDIVTWATARIERRLKHILWVVALFFALHVLGVIGLLGWLAFR